MAAEEDKKFPAVLGGFLVNDLRIRAGDLHCPESDTLAAYHERSLLPEEMNSWKEHIVGCARCQAILAELEATESIPVQVIGKEEVLTGASLTLTDVGEGSPPQKETPVVQAKSGVTPISRGLRWQWLAPAGALAAGLLIWVAWHENRSQRKAPTEIKTAKLEPPAAPPPLTSDSQLAVSADEVAPVSKDQGAVGGALATKPAPEPRVLKRFEKSDSPARVSHSEAQADKETGARARTSLDSLASANQNKPAEDTKAGGTGAMSETVEVQTPAANAELQNQQVQQNLQAQNQLNEQKVSGPNPSRQAGKAKKHKSESPVTGYGAAAAAPQSGPPPVPAPSAFNDSAALRMASVVSPYVVSAPDKKTLWRVGHLGMIEFSSDGGASWLRQVSNVTAELTAGSAPSVRVCWIVGRAGTILLSTDGGGHWTAVHSPLSEDLGGVRATDALHATVWNLANTRILETSDAGVTWTPAQAQ